MTRQMGSASGTAPASRETEATPGGASELTSESMTAGGASGGAPGVTEADWQEPGSAEPAGLGPAGLAAEAESPNSSADNRAARMRGWLRRTPPAAADVAPIAPSMMAAGPELDLASNDPLIGYLLSAASAVDITRLELLSPALDALQASGVVLVVPLISSGSLVGLLSLGPRRSERGYSTDDLRLLNSLAGYAAPAMRVGQLVRQQEAEARQRERIDQELKIAQLIQQQFLPKELPDLPSWHVAAFYRPARTVGGDFYDFIPLPDGRVMFVVGDVTDKGVPAALVMASTHALLRDAAPRLISPGKVLGHVNDMLCVDIPAHMFVTCLALVLDPVSGEVEFANAGHDVPYVRTQCGVQELRARGMPLGLMPGMP
jgi:Stage II sporulation protein E (SpoIIE)/GAF domain